MHNIGEYVNSFIAVPVHAEMSGSMPQSSMLLPRGHIGCLPPQVLTPVKQALSGCIVHQALVMVAHMSCYSSSIMAQTVCIHRYPNAAHKADIPNAITSW